MGLIIRASSNRINSRVIAFQVQRLDIIILTSPRLLYKAESRAYGYINISTPLLPRRWKKKESSYTLRTKRRKVSCSSLKHFITAIYIPIYTLCAYSVHAAISNNPCVYIHTHVTNNVYSAKLSRYTDPSFSPIHHLLNRSVCVCVCARARGTWMLHFPARPAISAAPCLYIYIPFFRSLEGERARVRGVNRAWSFCRYATAIGVCVCVYMYVYT